MATSASAYAPFLVDLAREVLGTQESTYAPPIRFDAAHELTPRDVLFVDNRPMGPDIYHRRIEDAYGNVKRVAKLDGLAALQSGELPTEFITDPNVRLVVEAGLKNGNFKDTHRVHDWVGGFNEKYFGGDDDLSLRFVVAHAETDLAAITRQIMQEGRRPAGVVLSGSPKMLSDAIATDQTVQQTVGLIQFLFDRHIPILGICFGLHLLAYARFGALVEWLTIPEDMHVRVFGEQPTVLVPVTPGARQMIYGPWMVQSRQPHPALKHVNRIKGLEVHSQRLPFPNRLIPDRWVLATSARKFRPNALARPGTEYSDEMIEVLDCGDGSIGTQLHPELTPELLLILSYMPAIRDSLLKEGHDVQLIRGALSAFSTTKTIPAGRRIGYNWMNYVLGLRYVRWLRSEIALGGNPTLKAVLTNIEGQLHGLSLGGDGKQSGVRQRHLQHRG